MSAKLLRRAVLLAPLLLLSGRAHATPNFPGAIRAELGLAADPDCSLCHVGPQRVGTVRTPFGLSMRARGLVFYDEDRLRTALAALEAERTDSDHDGAGDIDELRSGTDPNTAPGGGGPGGAGVAPEISYGCGATGALAPLGLFLLLGLLRRRPAPCRVPLRR